MTEFKNVYDFSVYKSFELYYIETIQDLILCGYCIFFNISIRKEIELISFIKGRVDFTSDAFFVIENNGIGYRIFASANTISNIKNDQEIKIYTYMNVSDDAITLYGFLSREEINIFNRLKTVQGVGPKTAVGILNTLTPDQIVLSIVSDDVNSMSKCPGIGKKTAQRIILELKDKMKLETNEPQNQNNILSTQISGQSEKQDAIDALTSLGYGRSESFSIVMEIFQDGMNAEQIIKQALKKLSRM